MATTLRTVERALNVLEAVAESTTPLTIKDISSKLGYNISSSYHLINTLLEREYLRRDGAGLLMLGREVRRLAVSRNQYDSYEQVMQEIVESVARETDETVYLTRYTGQAVVITSVVESQRSLRVTGLSVGYSGSEDTRASGKAVIAYLRHDELTSMLQRIDAEGGHRTGMQQHLDRELKQIRTHGYAFDDEEYEDGICCIAAPFFSDQDTVAGSIAVSVPSVRKGSLIDSIFPLLSRAADRLGTARAMESERTTTS